jgi:hypothetical protein
MKNLTPAPGLKFIKIAELSLKMWYKIHVKVKVAKMNQAIKYALCEIWENEFEDF